MVDTYIALGGNLAGTLQTMREVVARIKAWKGIDSLTLSKLYQTSPVSPIPQPDYLNAVCRFQTSLPLHNLWENLKQLEQEMGKEPKSKNSPRLIDLDLLFYGDLSLVSEGLTLPHPRWNERLFVLTPLADVTQQVPTGTEINKIIAGFQNPNQEKISIVHERLFDA